jgi:hypothetical protein
LISFSAEKKENPSKLHERTERIPTLYKSTWPTDDYYNKPLDWHEQESKYK